MVNIFGPPKGTKQYYNPSHTYLKNYKSATSPSTGSSKKNEQTNNDEDNYELDSSKKTAEMQAKTKTKKVSNELPKILPENETQSNTRLNSLLYHTSHESIDLYKQENNTSDLLGRLYYDDYDSESFGSEVVSPLLSPALNVGSGSPTDYFQSRLAITSASSSSISSLLNSNRRPGLSRLQSFERGISFDTSTDDHRISYTLKVKHANFKFRRNNKTFLAGFNNDNESIKAIEWLFEEMIVNGDTIVILQVLDEKLYDKIDKDKANKDLNKIEALNIHFKKVSLVFEVVIGKPQKLLKNAIDEYNPAMMIIGTHHFDERESHFHSHSHLKLMSKSSISKYFLEYALVPVIVVKPTYNYIEKLQNVVDSEMYFQDWIANTDIKAVLSKDKHKRRSRLHLLSPGSSRSSSYTNMSSMAGEYGDEKKQEDRGRKETLDDISSSSFKNGISSSRSSSGSNSRSGSQTRVKSRGFAKFFH